MLHIFNMQLTPHSSLLIPHSEYLGVFVFGRRYSCRKLFVDCHLYRAERLLRLGGVHDRQGASLAAGGTDREGGQARGIREAPRRSDGRVAFGDAARHYAGVTGSRLDRRAVFGGAFAGADGRRGRDRRGRRYGGVCRGVFPDHGGAYHPRRAGAEERFHRAPAGYAADDVAAAPAVSAADVSVRLVPESFRQLDYPPLHGYRRFHGGRRRSFRDGNPPLDGREPEKGLHRQDGI